MLRKMRFGARWWILLVLMGSGSEAKATLAITGSVLIEPPAAPLLRGQTATATFTVTNIGDEPLDRAGWGTSFFREGPTSTVFLFSTTATPPCIYQEFQADPPPNQAGITASSIAFHPRPIAPGESRTCVIEVQVSPQAAGPFVQMFRLVGYRADRFVIMDQSVAFNLGQPQSLPVPTISAWGLLFLTLLLLEVGRRRSIR